METDTEVDTNERDTTKWDFKEAFTIEADTREVDTKEANSNDGVSKKILCVGLVVVDIVTHVKTFPVEDSKSRCDAITEVVGGNAFTNCKILSMLGERASFMGCIGTGLKHYLELVNASLDDYRIDRSACVLSPDPMPQTLCLLNESTGSRTCLHYRGSLPELSFEMFQSSIPPLDQYSWIHFEGRYEYEDTNRQIEYLINRREDNSHSYVISAEIEKANPSLVKLLLSRADVIFISKDFSKFMGFQDMMSAAAGLLKYREDNSVLSDVVIICPWGSDGAAAAQSNSNFKVWSCPAFPPPKTVNTLGAGDTFNASCISSLSKHITSTTISTSETTSSITQANSTWPLAGDTQQLANHQSIDSINPVNSNSQPVPFNKASTFEGKVTIEAHTIQAALKFACKVAGIKCGLKNIEDLQYHTTDII